MTGRCIDGIEYADESPNQVFDLYLPDAPDAAVPVVIAIHGGAFRMGDRRSERELDALPLLLSRGYAVASVEYRLSGEAIFPAAVCDVKRAVAYLRAHAPRWNLDASFFAAWGRSAGGYLAAMLGVTSGQRTPFDRDDESDSRVSAVVDWYGPSDFLLMDTQFADVPPMGDGPVQLHDDPASPESAFLGAPIQEVPALAAQANPLTYIPSSPGLPPFFLAAGKRDRLVPHQQTLILADALIRHGAEVVLRILPEARHGDRVFEQTLTEPVVDWLDMVRLRSRADGTNAANRVDIRERKGLPRRP